MGDGLLRVRSERTHPTVEKISLPADPKPTDILRPRLADYYRLLLANQIRQAKKWGVGSDNLETFLGQSRGHTGTRNAYAFRYDIKTSCYTGNHRQRVVQAGKYNS